ncbi:uncharacterized protein At1g28695-like [Nymphaea colorata]|uniref:uncharacterized protein At1g28695-like n=1 Tax=Nymphaea colorata TaxID=210225 RepID=UPI00129E83E6|nr:uncharacterized protein At1g28695-like [Nymphaea colorata]
MKNSEGRNLLSSGWAPTSLVPAVLMILGSLVILGLLYSSGYNQKAWNFFLSFQSTGDPLDAVLRRVAMENKTLIITGINKPYAGNNSMLELFLEAFRQGEDTQHLLEHLLVVAHDQPAFERCQQLHHHCYRLVTDGVDFAGEKMFMSQDYLKMVWRRTLFIGDVLKRGYNFIYTDADIVWFRNPFKRFTADDDVQMSCDHYDGRPYDTKNAANTGFHFARSNKKTIKFYDLWYESSKNYSKMHDQAALYILKDRGIIEQLGLKFRFLDTLYFGGFCQKSRDLREVNTMHANCCRSIKAKLADLRASLQQWKKFVSAKNFSSSGSWPRHTNCINSWRTTPTLTN